MQTNENEQENSESSAESGAEIGESLAPNAAIEQTEPEPNALGEQITRLTDHVRMICEHFHLPHTL